MTHCQERLLDRVMPYHRAIAERMIKYSANLDNCAIVVNVLNKVSTADGSNGNNLVLIVRNSYPVTLMYVRSSQLTKIHLRVDSIVTL